ncbi:MAG: mechanosensitive ion channel family protein [Butyrivibrio sp.]|nr:mechanosensitive ion channel family protein [Butyrivibrio sp.]
MINIIWNELPDSITGGFGYIGEGEKLVVMIVILFVFIFIMALYILAFVLCLKINSAIFKRIEKKNGNSISYQFLKRAVVLVITMVFLVFALGREMFTRSLLGSTAVVAAVVGLAANDVIKDMFAGLQISLYKPFDIGSRVMLEDGRAGIVEKLTLRHVVLVLLDSTRLIIPNNKANSMMIVNYSYLDNVPRSFDIRIPVSYESDVDRAKEIIRKVICDCPLTLNKDNYKESDPNTRSVYFLEITDSAFVLGATVLYPHNIRTEVVKDELNTLIFRTLKQDGIDIPYNYMNVIMKK